MTRSLILARLVSLATLVALGASLAGRGAALAQIAPPSPPGAAPPEAVIPEVVVTGDAVRLIETRPNATVFGLGKPLLQTPRSATSVSDTTLERYGVTDLDKLVTISPSSYTASFYGVPGSLNVRGTLAENYFDGFKRVENRGTYTTPIGDAAQLDVVRGPPTPIYGAGKVGGFVDFTPKSAREDGKYLAGPQGEASVTLGSYNKKDVTLQGGAPVTLGPATGGVYGYLDADDSHSFYRGIYPKRQTAELSGDFQLPDGWSTSLDAMVYHSDGDVQTPGWNRLTQDLIDHGTYVTGRDTSIADLNGDGRLEPGELGGTYPNGTVPLYCIPAFAIGCNTQGLSASHSLDTGVGTTKLDPRTIYISNADFSRTTTYTVHADVAKRLSDTSDLKLQVFYDALNNERFVSYGFPGSYQSYVLEARATYDFADSFADGLVTAKSFVGGSWRYTHGHKRESFNSGVIALDRRDIANGATANDIIDSPFSTDDHGEQGLEWENDVDSNVNDGGLFLTSDIAVGRFDLILGGRYDEYDVRSDDRGVEPFEPTNASSSKGAGSWTLGATYRLPYGLIPYATYDRQSALEIAQASDVPTSVIANDGYLSASHLAEAGIKFGELHNHLVGSFAVYRQDRTDLQQGVGVTTIQGTRSQGFELEARWLATKNLSFTVSGDIQHTEVKGPDHSFVYLPAYLFGVSPQQGFGGTYATFDFTSVRPGDYDYSLVPRSVVSTYGTYTSGVHGWGQAGATFGATHVTGTSTLAPDPIRYPAYWLANLSGFYRHGPYTLSANIDNLFDARYFTPDADSYANLGALPGVGREWRIKLSRTF